MMIGPRGGRSSESTSTNLRGLGADGGEVRGHAEDEVLDFDEVAGADAGRLVDQEHDVGVAPPTAWHGNSEQGNFCASVFVFVFCLLVCQRTARYQVHLLFLFNCLLLFTH